MVQFKLFETVFSNSIGFFHNKRREKNTIAKKKILSKRKKKNRKNFKDIVDRNISLDNEVIYQEIDDNLEDRSNMY